MSQRARKMFLLALLLAVTAGCTLRFVELGHKVYWHDETITSIRIAGYAYGPSVQPISYGTEMSFADILRFQRPGSGTDVVDTARSLAQGDPQHPPVYYVLARFWAEAVGSSPAALRAFSALIGVLLVPCFGWLCLELFKSRMSAAIGAALVAVAPFHELYSQEAREFELWALTVTLASALLLVALRTRGRLAWIAYACALVTSLYTFPLSLAVVAAHGAFVVRTKRRPVRSAVLPWLAAASAAIVLFVPWIVIMVRHWDVIRITNGWTTGRLPIHSLVETWLVVSGLPFLQGNPSTFPAWYVPAFGSVLVVVLVGVVLLWRRQRGEAFFVTLMILSTALPLAAADIVTGGVRSTIPRYLIPSLLGVELSVAGLLTYLLRGARSARAFGVVLSTAFVAIGLSSYALTIGPVVWWNKDDETSQAAVAMAEIANRTRGPIVATTLFGQQLILSHLVRPTTGTLLLDSRGVRPLAGGARTVFLYGSAGRGSYSGKLLAHAARAASREGYRRTPVELRLPCCGMHNNVAVFRLQKRRPALQ